MWNILNFRYIKRGSDNFGDVANFVETEQVIRRDSDGLTSSFVQVYIILDCYYIIFVCVFLSMYVCYHLFIYFLTYLLTRCFSHLLVYLFVDSFDIRFIN